MTAMTVPPPGWVPIGARELQRFARKHLGRALVLSALGHLTLLALLLWVQARHPEETVRLNNQPVSLLPAPPIDTPLPPLFFPSRPTATVTSTQGTITPTDKRDPVTDPGTVVLPTLPGVASTGREDAGGKTEAQGHGVVTDVPPATQGEPDESESVPHDQEPVPVFHPDPEYPGWARESGVQGTVQLHVLVGLDGLVKRVVIRKDVIGLGDAARAGIARWTFRPAMFHGHPVAVWILIPVRFWLQ